MYGRIVYPISLKNCEQCIRKKARHPDHAPLQYGTVTSLRVNPTGRMQLNSLSWFHWPFFQVNLGWSVLLELSKMEVVVTTGAIRRAKLQSNRHHQQTNVQLFTGWMPFLSPTNSVKALKGKIQNLTKIRTINDNLPFICSSTTTRHPCRWREGTSHWRWWKSSIWNIVVRKSSIIPEHVFNQNVH